MILAFFSQKKIGFTEFLEGIRNDQMYYETMENNILPFVQRQHLQNFVFMQTGAAIHALIIDMY